MTHLSRHGALAPAVRALSVPLRGNRLPFAQRLATVRAEIAAIEAAWVTVAEGNLARTLTRAIRIDDRATWDRVTWDRYLAAATAAEAEFKPRLRRLYQQADNLERLLDAPVSEATGTAPMNRRPSPAAPPATRTQDTMCDDPGGLPCRADLFQHTDPHSRTVDHDPNQSRCALPSLLQ